MNIHTQTLALAVLDAVLDGQPEQAEEQLADLSLVDLRALATAARDLARLATAAAVRRAVRNVGQVVNLPNEDLG